VGRPAGAGLPTENLPGFRQLGLPAAGERAAARWHRRAVPDPGGDIPTSCRRDLLGRAATGAGKTLPSGCR